MPQLLNVDTALANILGGMTKLRHETVSLVQSLDRITAEDILSPIHLPPFDNSAMDGYAIYAADSQHASQTNPALR